jgi:hypothetical protein
MRYIILLSSLLAFGACQSSHPLPRAPMTVTPRPVVKPAPAKQTTDDAATQQWLSQEIWRQRGDSSVQPAQLPMPATDVAPAALQAHQSPAGQPQGAQTQGAQTQGAQPQGAQPQAPQASPPPQQTNEEATRAWLDRTIEERRNANLPPEPLPQQTVERTVYVDRPYPEGDTGYGYSYDRSGQLVYGQYSSPGYGYNPSFPIHTALGAGVGAVIGNQFHHQSGRGAAIGAGVGLLLDLAHWHW